MDCDRNSTLTLPVIQYPLSWSNPSKIEPFTPTVRNNRNDEEDEREFGEWPVKIVSYTPVVQGPNRTNQPSVQSLTHAEFAVRPNGPYHIPVLAARYPEFAGNYRTLVPANVSMFHAISRQQNMPVHQQRATGPPFPNMCYATDHKKMLVLQFMSAVLVLPERHRLQQVLCLCQQSTCNGNSVNAALPEIAELQPVPASVIVQLPVYCNPGMRPATMMPGGENRVGFPIQPMIQSFRNPAQTVIAGTNILGRCNFCGQL